MKSIFDRYSGKYDAWYDRNKFAYLSELLAVKSVLPGKGKGLEIGVGTGRFAAPLGIEYGVDPAKSMLDIAARRGVRVKTGSGERLPFAAAAFDYAALIVTLSFVRDPAGVLKETARILKKKGRVIVGIIDRDSFLGRYYRKKRGVFYGKADLLGVDQLKDMMKEAGFRKMNCRQTVFRVPSAMRSIHKTSKGYGRGGFVVVTGIKK